VLCSELVASVCSEHKFDPPYNVGVNFENMACEEG